MQDKKAAVAAYKERKPAAGIYLLRCASTGRCWAGRAPDLGTIRNRLWFSLRLGSNPHRDLQAAWLAAGADAFTFEPLEQLGDDIPAVAHERVLKERLAYWCEKLGAARI
jgi:hypothetical protein